VTILPERHDIVFDESPAADLADGEDLVQRLIYRADQPYRREYSAIRYPAELNRRPGWLAAVGPHVSVVCGHPDFIENSHFHLGGPGGRCGGAAAGDPPGRLR
jgi:hypothetical protein